MNGRYHNLSSCPFPNVHRQVVSGLSRFCFHHEVPVAKGRA